MLACLSSHELRTRRGSAKDLAGQQKDANQDEQCWEGEPGKVAPEPSAQVEHQFEEGGENEERNQAVARLDQASLAQFTPVGPPALDELAYSDGRQNQHPGIGPGLELMERVLVEEDETQHG